MKTPDSISKKKQDLYTKLKVFSGKLKIPDITTEQRLFCNAEIGKITKELKSLRTKTLKQYGAGWS